MEVSKVYVIDKLEGQSNWVDWKFQVNIQLRVCGVMEAVEGKLTFPEKLKEGADTNTMSEYQKQIDALNKKEYSAQNIIVSSVSSQVRQLINMCSSAKEMWNKLLSVYEQRTEQRQDRLFNEFFGIKEKDPFDSVAKHIAKLEKLWVELQDETWKEDKVKLPDSLFLNRVLNTLPCEYNEFINAWESVPKDQRTLSLLRERLCTVEIRMKEREVGSSADSNTAFYAGPKQKHRLQSSHDFKKTLSRSSDVTSAAGNKKNKQNWKPKCFSCHQIGHVKKDCPNSRQNSKSSGSCAFVGESGHSQMYDSKLAWVADSGATQHMTMNNSWFVTYEPFSTAKYVQVGNGQAMKALGKGRINVVMFVGKESLKSHLEDVWYVPEVGKNLFSITSTLDKGFKSTFTQTRGSFYKEGKLVAQSHRVQGLFIMDMKVLPDERAQAQVAIVNDLQLWHERLGHQNKRYVLQYLKANGISIPDSDSKSELCDACIVGKMHRLSFGTRKDAVTKPGDRINADVCGPMPVPSVGGNRYFVDFKDEYSKFRSVYILKEKSQVQEKLKHFLAEVKNIGHTVRELLTDNGKEFINQEVRKLTEEYGMNHRTTMPYTPQQNGASERENRTLVESARTMLHASNLPEKLWGEAIMTAAYVINRTGPSSVQGMTPYEAWFGKKASVNHLRVFGTECFVHVPKEKRKKFDQKARKGYLVGYCGDRDGYRVWIPQDSEVVLSRDVVFKSEKTVTTIFECSISGEESQITEQQATLPTCGSETVHNSSTDEGSHYNLRDRSQLKQPVKLTDCALLVHTAEPNSYKEAVNCKDSLNWIKAMGEEMEALENNQTWVLVQKPVDTKVIDCRWVYKVKYNQDGTISRFKARLVARGFLQQEGIDFHETFSPTVRWDTVRMVLSICAEEGLDLIQFDVRSAFLYGDLEETIYMTQPEGYDDGSGKVCLLKKSIYGLRQAPRCWNKKFTSFMEECDLKQSEHDPCLFVNTAKTMMITLHVDDGLVVSRSKTDLDFFIDRLKKNFEVQVSDARCYLGIQIYRLEDKSIFINQEAFARKILDRFHMDDAHPVTTPLERGEYFDLNSKGLGRRVPYREVIGALIYLTVATRPDLSFSVSVLSQKLDCPSEKNWEMAKRVLKYLKGTVSLGIHYKASEVNTISLESYSDSDYAGDIETRRSTSGVLFKYAGGPILWCSKRQRCVALSTTESELIAASLAVGEAIWLKKMFKEVDIEEIQFVLNVDNHSAIKVLKNPVFHSRTKHIDVRLKFVREKMESGHIFVQAISSELQQADILTKPLSRQRFEFLRSLIGMKWMPET